MRLAPKLYACSHGLHLLIAHKTHLFDWLRGVSPCKEQALYDEQIIHML